MIGPGAGAGRESDFAGDPFASSAVQAAGSSRRKGPAACCLSRGEADLELDMIAGGRDAGQKLPCSRVELNWI